MAAAGGDHRPGSDARVVLRPLGNPLPLAFVALAVATLLVSGLQLRWFGPSDGIFVGVLIAAFVVPVQLVAVVFGFLARDPVAATGVGVLAGTWLATALVLIVAPPGSTNDPLGVLLLAAGASLLVPAAAAVMAKLVAAAVMVLAGARFAASGVYELTGSAAWQDVAGVLGLVLCGVALYAALALGLEDARRATVLPTLRRGQGRKSIQGDLAQQTEHVSREAGVREEL